MRISSGSVYSSGVLAMQQQTEALMKSQQQIASGRRIVTPADDPVASAQVLQLSQSQSINAQYGANIGSAGDGVSLEESVLGNITQVLQQVRDVSVNAGDAVLGQSDRASLGTQVRSSYQQLLALANSTDGSGQYLFSGYRGSTQPFSETSPGVVRYNGDQGQRLIQVTASRQIAVSDAGDDVFQRTATGNGRFATAAGANTGSGVIDSGTVMDPAKWTSPGNGGDYTIRFSVAGGATTYDIIDNGSGNSLLTGAAPGGPPYARTYASGSAIYFSQAGPPAFDFGAQVAIAGTPADGDTFTVKPSARQSVFKTLDDLASLLQNSNGGAAFTNSLSALQRNLDHALDAVLSARTSAGARLKELDSIKTAGDSQALQYSQAISRLQDLDYAQAVSQLAQEQTNLQAAQQSFVKITGLSLFTYL